ncbi:GntR family transcriptional regulator [Actinomyces oricola]|uniref:GntR family transcriptional regulator n=1 Tax=Actinomyces oricola TaxID=206043 RepID=UPI000FFEBFD0|nr:GntR family transcriptional regulator [Actinomyces oricola]
MPTTPFTVDVKLDRSSPIPLYFQISEPIASAIQDGTLAAGTRLEDELSMAKRLQVSRPTARQALQRLVDRGLLTRRRGVGTLVAPTRVHRPMELTSLHSDLVAAGLTVTTAVLDYDEHPATEEEAELLETQAETPIVRLVRLRSTDDEPIALMTNLMPADIAPTRDQLEREGLYDLLRAEQVVPTTAHQVIGARNATAPEALTLGEEPGGALLTATRTSYDRSGRVIEYGNHLYRASRYSFETTLFAN